MIKMKKILAGLTALTMLCGISCADNPIISEVFNSVSVGAEDEALKLENGLEYIIVTNEENDEQTIEIKGCDENATEIEIPAEIDGLPVTSIGWGAFVCCTLLTSVTIPDSVKIIDCYAFSDCTSLTSVTIPDSVTSIGMYAFQYCESLTEVTISDSVTSIDSEAFSNTAILNNQSTDLKYVDNWLVQCDNKEIEKAEIKDGTRGIANSTFSCCYLLTEVTIPDSVTSIGVEAFYFCTSLTSVTIPDSVTSISASTFLHCISLKEVTIHDSVTSIGDKAFFGCTSLTSVTIPDSVTSIGDHAFGYYWDAENYQNVKIENFTIYGVKDSAAETYAIENEFNFVEIEKPEKTGDIDGNGETTSSDALNVLQAVTNVTDLTDEQKKLADLNGDGKITSADALYVLQIVVGLR